MNIKNQSIRTSNRLSKVKKFNAETVLCGNITKVDYHNHTNFTDGKNTVEECVIKAIDKGLTTIGFSEHVSKNEEWMKEWFVRYLEDIEMCKKKYKEIDILCGIEAKINDNNGNLNVDEKYIRINIETYFGLYEEDEEEGEGSPISDSDDPADNEYGGFWYKKGKQSKIRLMKFYEKAGYKEDPSVHLDWNCFSKIPYPSMRLELE